MAYRFAFDIGTNSLGWAIFELGDRTSPEGKVERQVPVGFIDVGVRLYGDGRDPKSQESLASLRRIPRGARRRRDRFLQRRRHLFSLLTEYGLLPPAGERGELFATNPYPLRARGVSEKLTLQELGRVMVHLNQRRGFKSNRKAPAGDDEESGKIATGAAALKQLLAEYGYETLGQYYAARQSAESPIDRKPVRVHLRGNGAQAAYDFYPLRQMVEHEFDVLWKTQASFHNELDNKKRDLIREAIFFQRPLKPVEPGRCTFFPDEPRLSDAMPSAQAFRIYQMVNNIRLVDGRSERKLSRDERDCVVTELLAGRKLTWLQFRKLLDLPKGQQINLELGGEKLLLPDQVAFLMVGTTKKTGPLRDRWNKITDRERIEIITILRNAEEDESVVAWAMETLSLEETKATQLSRIRLPDTYRRLSAKAIDMIVDQLEGEVITYSEAVKRCGFSHSDMRGNTQYKRLPYYNRLPELQRWLGKSTGNPADPPDVRFGRIANPTVHIGLNQLRRVCNALIDRYGSPAQIVVEIARELKQSKDQKRLSAERNRKNRDANDMRREKLTELGILSDGERRIGETLIRMRLWEELGDDPKRCPYTGKTISLSKLFDSEIEIEHILPFSRTLDDSPSNKTVAFREANRLKRNLSPSEAADRFPEFFDKQAMIDRVRLSGMPKNKQWRFEADAMDRYENEEEFMARQLAETQYLSRMATAYLECLFPPQEEDGSRRNYVWVVPGRLTFLLRRHFGISFDSNQRKNRDDHRHHALDAAVIGIMDRSLIQRLTRTAAKAEDRGLDRMLADFAEPFKGYRASVMQRAERIYVDSRARHFDADPDPSRTTGKLHEETYYGVVRDLPENTEARELGNVVRRKPVTALTVKDVSSVRDSALRKALQSVTEIDPQTGKSSFSKKQHETALAHWSERTGVKRVRVLKKESTLLQIINRESGMAYKAVVPAENAYLDIYEDARGRWACRAVDSMTANSPSAKNGSELPGRFIMRLHKGDFLQLFDANGDVNEVKLVHQLRPSAQLVFLACHLEGGELQKRHVSDEDSFRWDMASVERLRQRRARRVRFTPAGRMRTIPHGRV